jgi:DNA polymerase III delta prime subunit
VITSMNIKAKRLLSELLRAQQFGDLTLPQPQIDRLQRMVEEGSIMNMLFYGEPGLGKTSAARIFRQHYDVFEVNGSSETGVDFVRKKIEPAASSVSFKGHVRICFIDEADNLSKQAQGALRVPIEKLSSNCRFLFAANEIGKIIPPIKSRLLPICFDVASADREEVQARLIARYEMVLTEHGIKYDKRRLIELVGIYYPDLRAIANQIEFEFD